MSDDKRVDEYIANEDEGLAWLTDAEKVARVIDIAEFIAESTDAARKTHPTWAGVPITRLAKVTAAGAMVLHPSMSFEDAQQTTAHTASMVGMTAFIAGYNYAKQGRKLPKTANIKRVKEPSSNDVANFVQKMRASIAESLDAVDAPPPVFVVDSSSTPEQIREQLLATGIPESAVDDLATQLMERFKHAAEDERAQGGDEAPPMTGQYL